MRMKEKNIFSWIAALLIAVGFWMFCIALTGYPWWFTILQKNNWGIASAILTGFGISIFIIKVLSKEKELVDD